MPWWPKLSNNSKSIRFSWILIVLGIYNFDARLLIADFELFWLWKMSLFTNPEKIRQASNLEFLIFGTWKNILLYILVVFCFVFLTFFYSDYNKKKEIYHENLISHPKIRNFRFGSQYCASPITKAIWLFQIR